MNEIIILSSLGFIFGWITSRVNYKRKIIRFISNITFETNSSNKDFKKGLDRGIETTKDYIIIVVTKGKLTKEYNKRYNRD